MHREYDADTPRRSGVEQLEDVMEKNFARAFGPKANLIN